MLFVNVQNCFDNARFEFEKFFTPFQFFTPPYFVFWITKTTGSVVNESLKSFLSISYEKWKKAILAMNCIKTLYFLLSEVEIDA